MIIFIGRLFESDLDINHGRNDREIKKNCMNNTIYTCNSMSE